MMPGDGSVGLEINACDMTTQTDVATDEKVEAEGGSEVAAREEDAVAETASSLFGHGLSVPRGSELDHGFKSVVTCSTRLSSASDSDAESFTVGTCKSGRPGEVANRLDSTM